MSVSGTKRPPKRPKWPRASGGAGRGGRPAGGGGGGGGGRRGGGGGGAVRWLESRCSGGAPLRRGDEPPDLVRVLAPGRGLDAGVDVHGPGPDGGPRAGPVVARAGPGQDDRDPPPRA